MTERANGRGPGRRRKGPWRGVDDVELATLEWVDWFNHHRLHSACGDIRPIEHEQTHLASITHPSTASTASSR